MLFNTLPPMCSVLSAPPKIGTSKIEIEVGVIFAGSAKKSVVPLLKKTLVKSTFATPLTMKVRLTEPLPLPI